MEPLSLDEPTPKKMSEIDEDFRNYGLNLPTTGGCMYCSNFKPKGTALEVKEACEEHRRECHPELVGKRRYRRPHATPGVLAFRQFLTEEEGKEIDARRVKRMKLLGIDP